MFPRLRGRVWALAMRIPVFILASYGLFYFSYKYYQPWWGGDDFARYYAMYLHPLDFSQAPAPFVYRQLSAVVTHLLFRAGFQLPLQITFAEPGYDPAVFFSALLSNYLALLLTACLVSLTLDHLSDRPRFFAPLVGGLLCFASVFTQQGVLTGLTEGWAWFLAALGGYGYVTRRWPLVAVAASAAVVQRETLPIAFGVLAGMDLVLRARRPLDSFYVKVLVVSGVAFGAYLALRLAIAPVSGYAGQLDPAAMAAHLRDRFPLDRALLLQGVFSQNLYFLMLFTTAGLWYTRRRLVWADTYVVQLTVVLLVLWVGGLAAGAGNNIGRLAAVLTPLQAVFSVYHGMCSEEAPGNYSKLSISRTP